MCGVFVSFCLFVFFCGVGCLCAHVCCSLLEGVVVLATLFIVWLAVIGDELDQVALGIPLRSGEHFLVGDEALQDSADGHAEDIHEHTSGEVREDHDENSGSNGGCKLCANLRTTIQNGEEFQGEIVSFAAEKPTIILQAHT